MIWKTTNGLGQEVTWYSNNEVERALAKINEGLENG